MLFLFNKKKNEKKIRNIFTNLKEVNLFFSLNNLNNYLVFLNAH